MTTYKMIEVYAGEESAKVIDAISEKDVIIKKCKSVNEEGAVHYSFVVEASKTQEIMDALDTTVGYTNKMRAVVLPIEATIPKIEGEEMPKTFAKKMQQKPELERISREELTEDVEEGISLNRDFVLLVFFSTIVAAIGLVRDNIAVVIGAMVIAPLLWPSIALPFSATIGDKALMKKSFKAEGFGLALCIIFSLIFSIFVSVDDLLQSSEIISRTVVDFDNVLLALASGAAAALSLTTGLSSILVGVMVAVAVLPPLTTSGLMLGVGLYDLGISATIILMINLVCINISAQLIFLLKKVFPRKTDERKIAKKMVFYNLFFSILFLLALGLIIYNH